ncbi:MAG: hypothetical protein AABO58_24975 [Acidobacteriota bacterium]
MKKALSLSLVLLLAAAAAFAHGGHGHTYMGSVTMLHDDGSFMMQTTGGKEITVLTSEDTAYAHSDGHAAKRSELAVGMRVVVKMTTDGKTAASVKIGSAKNG